MLSRTETTPDLGALLRRIPGSYPTEVASILDELRLPYQVKRVALAPKQYSIELHPLYYEWYFTEATAQKLAEHIPPEGNALLIGAPTVAAVLARAHRWVDLIDKSPFVPARFPDLRDARVRTLGIEQVRPGFDHPDFILMDAPWYYTDLRDWLLYAHGLAHPGTDILFSLPPINVREAVEAERSRVLELARSIGSVTVEEAVLTYETPLFEREALRASGIEGLGDWRSGDLVTIRVSRPEHRIRAVQRRARGARIRRETKWWTHRVGPQVIKLRVRRTHVSPQTVMPIDGCPGNVLTSVSRRDPRRPKIGLWTSRNRVASIGRPADIRRLLNALERGATFDDAVREARARGARIDVASEELLRQVFLG